MDSLTHIAIGACMGEAFAGKSLGKKAMLWGAIAQSIPDIDFISSFWMDTASSLLAHRGFTHSFLFCAIITPFFALIAEYFHRPHTIRFRQWLLFFGVVIFTHIFIDAFNNYGVGWWEPFSHQRISFNTIYVADPFFSIWPIVASVLLVFFKTKFSYRKKYWQLGLGLSAFYLMYCLFNKTKIDGEVKSILKQQQVVYTRYFTSPAPLQNWLWYVVAGSDSGYHVGFRSLLDSEKKIHFQFFPRNDYLLKTTDGGEDLPKLIRFSQQFYTVEQSEDSLVFNDLRFGQVMGWQNPLGKFVFHYYLLHPADNRLVVQRGRLEGWNINNAQFFVKRILGH
jgi:inner membrane protein